jgi:hypothetical protein
LEKAGFKVVTCSNTFNGAMRNKNGAMRKPRASRDYAKNGAITGAITGATKRHKNGTVS